MLAQSLRHEPATACVPTVVPGTPTCYRDPQGALRLTSRCALLLMAVGLAAGLLTGLFGVGGGFIIVPALVAFSGMPMHRAIGTSLLVIALVSLAGIASHMIGGGRVPWMVALPFLLGSLAGLAAGTALAQRLAGPRLQQIFAGAIVAVGLFVIARNLGT
jgi:uncharacterized membrane protein YfcA